MFIRFDLVALTLVLALRGQVHSGEIIGGHEAVAHSRPYMALLVMHQTGGHKGYCGGFLLNEHFVMTAAHCKAKSYDVLLGLHDFYKPTTMQNVSVCKVFPHADYNEKNYTNDIMLLKLSSKVKIHHNVSPINLTSQDDATPKSCIVCGWGKTSRHNGYQSHKLMEVNVTVTETAECENEHVYCTKGEAGPGEGDSGGPLVCDGKAYGVVSVRRDTQPDQIINKYTKIPDYRKWIDSIMKQNRKPRYM